MSADDGINARFGRRGLIFCDADLSDKFARIYGLGTEDLNLADSAGSVRAFRVRRPGVSRVVLAPFNFQPVLADRNEEIARKIIALAEGGTARIKLHHLLPDAVVSEFSLSLAVDGVETLISLEGGFDAVLARMRPRHRSKLRAVRRNCAEAQVEIIRFGDDQHLEAFYRILVGAYRDKHAMLPQPLSLFRMICSHEMGHRKSFGYAAIDSAKGRLLGGIVIQQDEVQWTYGWGASTSEAADLEIGTLLIGHALEQAIDAGTQIFSLGMSSISQDDLRRYKRGWGGEEHDVFSYGWRENVKPIDLHSDFALVRKVLRHTPKPLIEAISPLAVKWLV